MKIKRTYSLKGFTLLEILVVLVIMSIVASMAMLTIGRSDNRKLKTFANELVETITLAEEEALLQPAHFNLIFTENTFGLYQNTRAEKKWDILPDHSLGLHSIPDDIQITLKVSGKIVPLNNQEPNNLSSILISPNGSITPFTLLIGRKNKMPQYEIVAQSDGSIESSLYETKT